MVYWPNGQIDLSSGGWRTSVTRERINRYLPFNWQLRCTEGVWWLRRAEPGYPYDWLFEDGITVSAFGILLRGQAFPLPKQFNAETLRAVRKLKKRIKAYAQLCASKIPLEKPGPGDCWICCADMEDHRQDRNHLESHMAEGYVVPRLVYNALVQRKAGDLVLGYTFTELGDGRKAPDFVPEWVQKSVYKWVLSVYGIQVH
jgi:hypothetical protein